MKPLYIGLLVLASVAFCKGHPDPPIVDNDEETNNSNGDCCNKEETAPSPSIFDLNRAIAHCGPKHIQQTCDCDINNVYITECLCGKMREKMTDFPNKGCLSMEDIGCEFDKYFDANYERKCTPEEEADDEEEEDDEECEEDEEYTY